MQLPTKRTSTTEPMTCDAFATRTIPAENARCAQDTAVTGRDTRSIVTLWETTGDFMLQGLDSWTYLLTQRETFGTPHSGSGAPRTGTPNFKCLGVLVVFDSDELAQLLDAVDGQRPREQIRRIALCRNLHHI